ncbi:MAG: Rieske 2Fe-2S domain-containing protein [Planctomycetes bacterium]|nr:Rieske 2Fe-2S domain-containing protein [Planctomycetota bacterium]MCB9920006.1 Rieske 2Fe-2S domain-containing protein [Planctomycetota bacterium]
MLSTHASTNRPPKYTEAWRDHCFPLAFEVDIEDGRLHRVTVFDSAYVVFRDQAGAIRVLEDRCPHRMARLSDGRLVGGEVECLYHGWRFAADGRCTTIPQLEAGKTIPKAMCAKPIPSAVRQGIVWIHGLGKDVDSGNALGIPTIAALERADCHTIDFSIDLPYGHDFLIENVLDYAHIHVAHDGVRGGGHGGLAGPLAFDVGDRTAGGFSASFGRLNAGRVETGADLAAARVEFVAPGLVHYWSEYRNDGASNGAPERIAGLALYSLPLGQDRCRLLYRAYTNFAPLRDRLRPRFWEHGYQCHLLEQDMGVVRGQAEALARSEEPLHKSWRPLGSSDTLVLAYRSWLDEFAAGRPDAIGLRTRGSDSNRVPDACPTSRLTDHVAQCSSCRRALSITRRVRAVSHGAAFVLLAAAVCYAPSSLSIVLASAAVASFLTNRTASALCERLTKSPDRGGQPANPPTC